MTRPLCPALGLGPPASCPLWGARAAALRPPAAFCIAARGALLPPPVPAVAIPAATIPAGAHRSVLSLAHPLCMPTPL